jgi:Ankyrin repeats (3 copies)
MARQQSFGEKFWGATKRLLWVSSLLCVLSGLFYVRHLSQAHTNVDWYFTAIHQLNTPLAANLLSSEPFDKAYFSQRLKEDMSSEMFCSAIESATTHGLTGYEDVFWNRMEGDFHKNGNKVHSTEKLLILALKSYRLKIASELLKNGAVGNGINGTNENNTPLILACQAISSGYTEGYEECFDLLLQHKINVNQPTSQGGTALHTLAYCNTPTSLKCIEKLVKNEVNIDQADQEGLTPLSLAATTGNVETVRLLLQSRANPNTIGYMIYFERGGRKKEAIPLLQCVRREELKPARREKKQRFKEIAMLLEQYGAKTNPILSDV